MSEAGAAGPARDPEAENPSKMQGVAAWPIVEPGLPPEAVRRLRGSMVSGRFDATAVGAGAPGARSRRRARRRVLLLGFPLAEAASVIGAADNTAHHGGIFALAVVSASILAIPAFICSLYLILAVCLVLSPRDRTIKNCRERYVLPRDLAPEQRALISRAAAASAEIQASTVGPGIADPAALSTVLWDLTTRARRAGELKEALGTDPRDADELVAEAIAPFAAAVTGAHEALRHDVEALENLAETIARADRSQGALARLTDVQSRAARVTDLITATRGDRPQLDDEVLRRTMTTAQREYDDLVAEARGQARLILPQPGSPPPEITVR